MGAPSFDTLEAAAQALQAEGVAIDIVDSFRASEDMLPVAQAAIAIGALALWMQLGVHHDGAAAAAQAAGLTVVSDHCLKVEHRRLLGQA